MSLFLALLLALPLQVDGGGGELDDAALVKRIRETLVRIDESLLETSETTDARASLAAVRERHLQVIRDLEELIKNQKYQRGGGGGGGGGGSSDSGGENSGESQARPSDGSGAPQPGDGETSPPETGEEEAPGGAEEQPEPEGSQGGRPESALGDDNDPGRNEESAGPPPQDPIAPVTRQDVDERWGLLPPKLQERLMNLHVDDVPERYRGWMEAYVRSMHALENRASGQGSGSGGR